MNEATECHSVTSLDPAGPAGGGGPLPPAAGGEPDRIGKYEIVRVLGRGGMGVVYQAHDPLLERDVALKVMLPTIAEDPELKLRFEREARAVARLMHPAVVTLFDLGYHTDGSPYIVMELLRGRDLVNIMRHGPPLALERKVAIVLQVLDGLGHAHDAGIVHRDIKPANVFVSEDGAAKIMDFGIARFMSAEGTGTGSVMGTANYMSPEQVQGDPVDGRSDLFSVGTLLCELLTGRRPFDSETMVATLFRIAHGEPELGLPPGAEHARFEPVLRRALARSPRDRYDSAAEFAAALQAALDRQAADGPAPAKNASRKPATRAKSPAGGPRADPRELFRLLREVQAGGRSGHLHFAIGGHRKTVAFLRGEIVYGTSDTAGEHLGDLLVEGGLLGRADLERALQVVLGERKRLGTVLLERGLVERARLEEAIGLHARSIFFGALEAEGVSFSFEELSESLLDAELARPVPAGQVILEATRRLADPALLRSVLGDTGGVLKLSANPTLRDQKLTLTPADGFVLSRIDGTLTAGEVVGLIPMPAEDTERSLLSLLCTGIVTYEEKDGTRAPSSSADVARTRGRADREARGTTAAREPTAVRHEPRPASTAVRQPAPSAPRPAPKALPATEQPGPSPARQSPPQRAAEASARSIEEIRRLILETHARLKLDHFEVLGLERTATEEDVRVAYGRLARVLHPDTYRDSTLDDMREMRQQAFIRVSEACETLRNPTARARYEQAFAPRSVKPVVKGPAAASSPPGPPSPAQEPNGSPAAQPVPPLRPRDASPALDAPSAAGIDPRLAPARVVAAAKVHFEKGQYWDAIQQLEPLIAHADGPAKTEGMLLLAEAYLKNPRWTRHAEGVLRDLLAAAPDQVPALLLLAQIYAGGRLVSRAKGLYEKVLKLSPAHAEAARGLAALDGETQGAKPAVGGIRRLLRVG